MKARTIGAVLATALTVTVTAGCGGGDNPSNSAGGGGGKPVIGVDYPRSGQ